MPMLVLYASRHGATREIAERLAERLTAAGQLAQARPLAEAGDLAGYDGFVIGSATYAAHWLKDAAGFVRRHRELLAGRPVWLFSSGPLGAEAAGAPGRGEGAAAAPREVAELVTAIRPREHRVFFRVLDLGQPWPAGPVARKPLPGSGLREWPEIDRWARDIAAEMAAEVVQR